ncbi:MAG: PAS domain S-box protein [Deltaproteobacteria bacterium]|nr:PAS domain S-box protein [Deltaproteobacteria bacterium]
MNAASWVSAILGVSILLQVIAAVLALRLVPVSRGRAAWYLIAAAIFLMAVRRIIPFYALVFGPGGRRPDPWAESIALVISLLMVAGIYLIRPLLEDRKKAQESLRDSEERLRAIFEHATDGVVLVDVATNRLAACNEAMCRLLGYTAEEARGLGASEIHPAEELPRVTELYGKQSRRELAVAEEVPVRRKDGTVFSADVTSVTAGLAWTGSSSSGCSEISPSAGGPKRR